MKSNGRLGIALSAFAMVMVACGAPTSQGTTDDAGPDGGVVVGPDATSGDDSGGGGPGADGASSTESGSTADAGSTGDGGAVGREGGAVTCTAFGGACTFGAQCCSGSCDSTSGTCVSSVTTCSPPTAPCTTNTDCCAGACVGGVCGANQCLSIGAACPVAGDVCCTGNCSNGTCQPIAPGGSCTTAGNACTSGTNCCSGLCDAQGHCALASSYCIQSGDICYHANDCCGGVCTAPNGQAVSPANAGTCSQPSSGSVNCTGVDGSLCPGGSCGSCCSRLCAPYGPTGVSICQPAQGCRVEGDLCRTDADCCGALGSGVLGDGAVVCSTSTNGGDVGVCTTPGPTTAGGTCVPEGDVCHYNQAGYTCSISSARSDCCGPQNPKFLACVLDSFGVPRCNAYTGVGDGGPGCIAAGQSCAMATECCNGNPCVPDGNGHLTCSPNTCQQGSQSCTTNADCCAGLPCVMLPGSTQGTCSPVPPPTPPPPADAGTATSDGGTPTGDAGTGTTGDAGTTDAGFSCALYGQSCTSLPCCTGTDCVSGKCLIIAH